MDIVLLAAVAENGVIGRGNALAVAAQIGHAAFPRLTMGKPVVMGRKTYLSIGKPLKGRTTIVVSRDPAFAAPGIVVAPSLDGRARRGARRRAAARRRRDHRRRRRRHLCAGPAAGRRGFVITEVHKRVEGDARFPAIDPQVWRESARSEQKPAAEDEVPFAFVTYERVNDGGAAPPAERGITARCKGRCATL